MLVLTRRPGEALIIEPQRELIVDGAWAWFTRPIEVWVLRVQGNHVRIGIDAVEGLRIWRGELGRGL